MNVPVPFVDLAWQQRQIEGEVKDGWAAVLERTAYVGGPDVSAFESEFADFNGGGEVLGVGNGTDALELALRALGIGHGDDVVIPANTFIATAEAVGRAGARPVCADVDEDTLLLTAETTAAALTPSTKAVIPVHLFGQTAPVEEIAEVASASGALVVEDAAQSQGASRHGRSAGRLGAAAGTSFYPGKNLGAFGDAGAVLSEDETVVARARVIASHGSARKYDHEVFGFNSRLDTLQAVVLRAKLRRLPEWNELRRDAAKRYDEMLAGLPGVRLPVTLAGNIHVWHLYVVRVPNRDEVLHGLHAAGVGAGIHYPQPVHLTGAFATPDTPAGSFPVAERAATEILSLPMFPGITVEQQERTVAALADVLAS